MAEGILYLVPVGLGAGAAGLLPPVTLEIVHRLRFFVAENPKSARAFLKDVKHPCALQELTVETLDEHTPDARLAGFLEPLEAGTDCALISEAGAPAVADPGAALVRRAHQSGIRVVPLVGPSAVLLAIMASGLNGQRFAFHGYLPVERAARTQRLLELERESESRDVAQVFIEAPYRNDALFAAIAETCRGDTLLCIASDLTLPREEIRTLPMSDWKAAIPALNRRPTVFALYRERAKRDQKR
jgi:16S rRNA (cytidine1402-2'-O)-methyltransferase